MFKLLKEINNFFNPPQDFRESLMLQEKRDTQAKLEEKPIYYNWPLSREDRDNLAALANQSKLFQHKKV